MGDIPPNVQAVVVALLSILSTWYATKSTERGKQKELTKDSQSQFMQTILEEMDELKLENKDLRAGLDAVRDELRQLKADKRTLEYERDEMARVLARVAQCSCMGCPNAARAAEFGGAG